MLSSRKASWSFTILLYWDFAKNLSQRQKVEYITPNLELTRTLVLTTYVFMENYRKLSFNRPYPENTNLWTQVFEISHIWWPSYN